VKNTNLTETGDEHSFSKRGSNSCSGGGTCDVSLVKNAMTSRELGKDEMVYIKYFSYQVK
jgi:hypothetical protein